MPWKELSPEASHSVTLVIHGREIISETISITRLPYFSCQHTIYEAFFMTV